VLLSSVAACARLLGQSDQAVYTDTLQNGWEAWGWTQINYASTAFVHSGTKAISVTITNNSYQAIYLHHAAQDTTYFTNLSFWINGGTSGGQLLQISVLLNGVAQPTLNLPTPAANSWQQVSFSTTALGIANQPNFDGFWIQDRTGSAQPTFYLDDITLVGGSPPSTQTNTFVKINVDVLQNRHAINPLIYGVAFASASQLASLNAPINRSGGNAESRYNWQINAHNRAADWYFESLGDGSSTSGAATDGHIQDSKNGGAESMITVPMIGWVAKLGSNRAGLASYSIAKYGPQTARDSYFTDAGNGIGTNTVLQTTWLITTNDPNDANVLTDSLFQQNWIRHLTNVWGPSTNGGVRFYCMDNEHTLWHSTHRDVHPVGTTMQEIRDKFFDYATRVKEVDPDALIAGPEEWGWPGYFYSGYDLQWRSDHSDYNQTHYPDRATNGGWDYMPWFLDQARGQATNTNQRLLDYFTLHIYPQAGEFGNDTSTAMQLRRNRSTRCLWDPSYRDETWINDFVNLIPRMKSWVAGYYPGTKIGITEYNWGAESHINGATAQADIFGIFGREGIDLATRWTTPAANTSTFNAMKMYRNYDGNQSGFGDTSVLASGPNPDIVSAFAAIRSIDGALTLIAINKQIGSNQPIKISLNNFLPHGIAQVWQLTSANTITRLTDLSFSGGTLSNTLPAQSITMFIVPGGQRPSLRLAGTTATNTFNFWLDGQAGQSYEIQSSSNLVNWASLQTNALVSNSLWMALPATDLPTTFFRAQWLR
jgi:Glycoside hydrolase family 44